MTPWDKYLYICKMAMSRYSVGGEVVTHIGDKPTRYSKVCEFAFDFFVRRNPTLAVRPNIWQPSLKTGE